MLALERRQQCGTQPPAAGPVLLPGAQGSLPAMSAVLLGHNLSKESHAVALFLNPQGLEAVECSVLYLGIFVQFIDHL